MRKVMLIHTMQTLIIWAVWYTIYTIVIWEFKNPFQWILNIPEYSQLDRGMGLMAIIMYQGLSLYFWYQAYKLNKKSLPEELRELERLELKQKESSLILSEVDRYTNLTTKFRG